MHFSLFTAAGAYNLGDELILLQEYEYLRDRYENATFTIFTYDRKWSLLPKDPNIKYVCYFPDHIRTRPIQNILAFFETLFAIYKSDRVIIGGGGLIYDNEEGQSFDRLLLQWHLRVWIAKFFHKPIIYWSLGIHIKTENETKILPLFEGKNTYVSVRDTESRKILENLGIKSILIFDPVLLYDPEIPQLMPKKRPKVGLSFRAGYLQNELENIEKIITFLGANGYEVILLNHSFHPINPLSNDSYFLSGLREKYSLRSTETIKETLELYKELEFVIGMRLHSLILAFVHTIPFFAISYSQKTDEFIRSINYDFSLAARVFDVEVFKKQFSELEKQKNEQKFALERKNDTIKRELYLNLNSFFDGLERTQK